MSDPTLKRSRQRCPLCGSRVKRVLRNANDKRRWDADDYRRYRCRSDVCGWRGLLRISHHHRHQRTRAGALTGGSTLARAGRMALALLLAAGLAWGGMVTLQLMTGP